MERKGILLVDDEAIALKYFSKSFGDRYSVYSAASASEALQLLELHHNRIAVVLSDQRMPESSGVELLKAVRSRYPRTVRILTTAYSELDPLVEAINTGAVYQFVSKPWRMDELEETLRNAIERHESQLLDEHLLEQRIDDLRARILDDRAYDIGQIAAKLGHYVHNALCPLTFLIDRLLDKTCDPRDLSEEFIRSVKTHASDVARTLKDLDQISQPPSPLEFVPVDAHAILGKTLADTVLLRRQKDLRMRLETAPLLPLVRGVPAQIEKLFRFLIAEEVVSLPQGSEVSVRILPQIADGETVGIEVQFEDFVPVAPGVNPMHLLHPFNLRGSNPREFGVFLVSCYFICRHHGGSLSARIRDEGGIIFSVILPVDGGTISLNPLDNSTASARDARRSSE